MRRAQNTRTGEIVQSRSRNCASQARQTAQPAEKGELSICRQDERRALSLDFLHLRVAVAAREEVRQERVYKTLRET